MRWFSLLPVVALCHAQAPVQKPSFSAAAVYVYGGTSSRSPDGKRTVSVHQLSDGDFRSLVKVTSWGHEVRKQIDFGLNAEVLWSPDSSAFALTGSDTGANAAYWTDVFLFDGAQVRQVPITRLVQRAFGHPVKCEVREGPNVGAVKWLTPSKRLLVAAEIVAHTVCDSPGTFKAYEVDLENMRIVRTHGQIETKRLFGTSLGLELSSANDQCITNPKSCEVPSHHQ